MDTYRHIVRSRRLVGIGIAIGYLTAAAATVLRILNAHPLTAGEVAGSLALGAALATPSTLALLSLDRRPSLLGAATVAAVAVSPLGTVFLPLWLVVAYLWYRGDATRPVRPALSRGRALARFGLGALVLVSVLVLFVHRDPVCRQELADGTTREVDAASRGLTPGWGLSVGSVEGSSSGGGGDVVAESCTSDTIVLPEAVASLAVTAAVVAMGRRWPRGVAARPPREEAQLSPHRDR